MSKTEYEKPTLTVDGVVFTIHNGALKVLLVRRKRDAEIGKWALPGGFVEIKDGEIPEIALSRELMEETNVSTQSCYIEQLYTFASPTRDPRGYTVTIAHLVLLPTDEAGAIRCNEESSEIGWFHVHKPEDEEDPWIGDLELAFDHKEIFQKGFDRLETKIQWEPRLSFTFLPKKFTQPEMRALFQTVKQRLYTRQAFSKRFTAMREAGKILQTEHRKNIGHGRPQHYYMVNEAYVEGMAES